MDVIATLSSYDTNCGSLPHDDNSILNKIDCATELEADSVKLTFTQSFTALRGLCTIGIWGKLCSDEPYSITEPTWTPATTTFNLLSDATKNIAHPSLTITPDPCYKTTWSMKKKSDNTDMLTTAASTYANSGNNLVVTHTVSNFANR